MTRTVGLNESDESVLSSADQAVVVASGLLSRCAFPPVGSPVVCAVSGGADSVALLTLAVGFGLDVSVVHVDHGLRSESGSDAAFVAELCDRWGVSLVVERLCLRPGPNLEARARSARYGVLPLGVLTGHTADDLAETMLLNLMRGAGLDGLSPMRARVGGPLRPLLGIRRTETVALCAALGVTVVDDAMNHDDRFRRVRVRRDLIPLLDDIAARDVVAVLARQGGVLAEDAAFVDSLSLAIDPTDAKAVASAPMPLAGRAVRRWLSDAGVTEGPVASVALVERVLHVARGEGTGADLVGGWRVQRTAQRLRLVRR